MRSASTGNVVAPLPWAAPGLALLAALFLLSQGLQPCDDAYITFRHAKNLALHGAPSWNHQGDPVLGSTSPVFVFLLGGLAWFSGADRIEAIALGVNALAHFAIVLLGYALARDLLGRQLPALLAAALIGFHSVNVFVFSLGFEAALFTALLLASLLSLRRERDGIAVVLASAAPLVRPEGVLLTPLVWGALLLARRIRTQQIAAFVVLPALWTVFAGFYYGSVIPQSIRAKQMTPAVYRPYEDAEVDLVDRLRRVPRETAALWTSAAEGALFSANLRGTRDGLRQQLTRWIALAGLLPWIATALRRRDGRIVHLLYPLGFLLLYGWIGRSEVWYYPSFVTTTTLLLFAACCDSASRVLQRFGVGAAFEMASTLAIFGLFLFTNHYALNREQRSDPAKGPIYAEDPRGRIWQRWERERFHGYREAARLLDSASDAGDSVLISEVGVFGYFYDGPVVDAIGLCSPEALSFYPPPPEDLYDARGEYRTSANTIIPSRLVKALRPDYLVSAETYIPHLLEPGTAFLQAYTLQARTGQAWATPIVVFRRSIEDAVLAQSSWFEAADASVFSGHPGPRRDAPYDVVASDLDLDGDPDLLVNWHHLQPLELYRNDGGRFERINAPGRDVSGLFENRGIPDLYAESSEMLPRIEALDEAGLYLWHDRERKGSWHFFWRRGPARSGVGILEIEANLELSEVEGLEAHELQRPDTRAARITLESSDAPRRFRVKVAQPGSQLKLRLASGPGVEPAPFFVGPQLTRVAGAELELWMPDPHGMAWAQVEGSRHPELFLTRGGIQGKLRPPLDAKVDRYYVHRGAGEPMYRMTDPGVIPPGYGRGRRVEWVDLDADGVLELSITNFATPNSLLVRDPATGVYRDRAEDYGLALDSEVGAWGDLDRDGLADFFQLRDNVVDVARNLGNGRFEHVAGETLGLVLPPGGADRTFSSLRFADFDNDGELDLWVLGYAQWRSNHLFRREGEGFRDVSQQVELARVRGSRVVVLGDFDNDSLVDAVSFGRHGVSLGSEVPYRGPTPAWARPAFARAVLWRNRGGQRFEFAEVPLDAFAYAATALDADSDGRTDLAIVGEDRALLRNATAPSAYLRVVLRDGEREPIGALVRVHYGDGSAAAARYGSAHNTTFSQALRPLDFGIPEGVDLESISVHWSGEPREVRYPVSEPGAVVILEREAGLESARPR